MPNNGLTLKKQAELISGRIRAANELVPARAIAVGNPALADVVHLPKAPVQLDHPPTTRSLDDKGRLNIRIKGQSLAEVMSWSPTALEVARDGHWIVLRPSTQPETRRNDGTARLGDDGRLRLPAPVRRLVGADAGDELAVLVLPERGVLAICHPSWLLAGAPLGLLNPGAAGAELN